MGLFFGTEEVNNKFELRWSVFSRPIRSRFTRCQRVSACMALLYLSFLVNAMFYDGSTPRITDPLFALGVFGFDPVDVNKYYNTLGLSYKYQNRIIERS